jgi:hypothetical protein
MAVALISCEPGGIPVTHLDKRQGGGRHMSSLRGGKWHGGEMGGG